MEKSNSQMPNRHVSEYIKDLLNPDKGFFLIKGFLDQHETDQYRREAEQDMQKAPRSTKRINAPHIPDYVHPRTVLPNGVQVNHEGQSDNASTYRLYQFLHNKHSKETEDIFHKTLSLRDQVEERWLANKFYRQAKEALDDYVQVTKYIIDSYGLPKHTDSRADLPYPLLQCLILLSQPEIDFSGGEFILFSKSGLKIRTHSELNMGKGDALFFDKSLYHQVEPTQKSNFSDIGRWSVIIGARHPKPQTLLTRISTKSLQIFRRLVRIFRACK